jgi:hypothetical protein
MSPLDLVRSRDGSMSLTKLAAATFHFWIAVAVVTVTAVRITRYVMVPGAEFDASLFDVGMWTLWGSVAVGHAFADKTGAQIAAFKQQKLEIESTQPGALGQR